MARDAYLHFIWSEQNFENPFTLKKGIQWIQKQNTKMKFLYFDPN